MNTYEKLSSQISKLTTDQLTVFKMKTIDKLSTDEISQELNLSDKVIWELLHQARAILMNGV